MDWLGGSRGRWAADWLVALGGLAALPAAAAGLNDWSTLDGTTRRLGLVHGLTNIFATGMFGVSCSPDTRVTVTSGSCWLLPVMGQSAPARSSVVTCHSVMASVSTVRLSRTFRATGQSLPTRPSSWSRSHSSSKARKSNSASCGRANQYLRSLTAVPISAARSTRARSSADASPALGMPAAIASPTALPSAGRRPMRSRRFRSGCVTGKVEVRRPGRACPASSLSHRHWSHRSHDSIRTLDSLRRHLQWAIELEHSTIPPYLCAFYSVDAQRNPDAHARLAGVLVEERCCTSAWSPMC